MFLTGWYHNRITSAPFRKASLLLAICLLSMVSCDEKLSKQKGAHLSKDLMQKVLLDVNIAETYSTMVKDTVHKIAGKNYDSLAAYYKSILAHHKISAEEFTNSLNWYKLNPDEMDSIYVKLIPVAEKITVTPIDNKK